MTYPLAISQRQAQSLLRAAEAEKAIVEVKLGNTVFRLIPNCRVALEIPAIDESRSPASFGSLDEYRTWRDRTRANRD